MRTSHEATSSLTVSVETQAAILELRHVRKEFGAVVAVADASLALRRGQVVGLVGENGAGKSTCVKMLAGVHRPDSGEVLIEGVSTSLSSPIASHAQGIAVVHQHPTLFPELSLVENIFAGQYLRTASGALDWSAMRDRARELLPVVGLMHAPDTIASRLRSSEQQLVEVARALASSCRVLVLDEPTAALSLGEVQRLFSVVRDLTGRGVAVLFVGHRLEEILELCDSVTVMRDGTSVDTVSAATTTAAELAQLMVGRPLSDLYPRVDTVIGDDVLRVTGLSSPGVRDASLTVRAGEIVGIAGLVGSGRTELAQLIFGLTRPTTGQQELGGERYQPRSAADALARGVAYVSEDRRGQSLVEDFSILENATLPAIQRTTRFGLVIRRLQMRLVSQNLADMRLRFSDYDQPVSTLSGGNQQKVVLAKWLATSPRLLILDEPTQGVDVQAKAEVHRIISQLAAKGLAILLISSDLPEVLGMSDRVLVMREGQLVAEFPRSEASQERVGLAVLGVADNDNNDSNAAARRRPAVRAASTAPEHALPASARATGGSAALRGHLATRLGSSLRRRESGLLAALVAIAILVTVVNPRFVSGSNLRSLGIDTSLLLMVAIGQLVVMLTRNIDLSVASTIGLCAYVSAAVIKAHPGLPVAVPVLLAVAIGLAAGLVNGFLVAVGRIPSIVVTLATLAIFRGVDAVISDGRQVAAGDVPQKWLDLTSSAPAGVPMLVLIAVVVVLAARYALAARLSGRYVYQSGSQPEAAAMIGVPVNRTITAAFAVSGALAGLTGAVWASHYATVDGQAAYGLELTVIASVVVGGVALRGGYGSVIGVVLGTLTLLVIQNALVLARVDPLYLQAFYGLVILAAVGLDAWLNRRKTRPTTPNDAARGAREVLA